MPFVPFNWQLPLRLSSRSQPPYIVNIKEIPILKEQVAELQARNLELEIKLIKEQEDKQKIEVEHSILEMELASARFEIEKLENERIEYQKLQIYNTNLVNTLESLTKDYKDNLEELESLKKMGMSQEQQLPEISQLANQLELTKQLDELSAKYQSLATNRDQMEAELTQTKVELAKFIENCRSSTPTLTWKRVLKSQKLKYKKKQERLKCIICRKLFSNPILLYRHKRKCRRSADRLSVSSKASSVESSVTQVRRLSPNIKASTRLNTHEATPSTSSRELIPIHVSKATAYSDSTEAIQLSDVIEPKTPTRDTSNPSTSTNESNATPALYPNYPKAHASLEFRTPQPPPPIRLCSVSLCRISPEIPFNLQKVNDSSSSVVLESQKTRDSFAVVKKHSRDLTKRHTGYYCLCKLQFPNRQRLDRHLEHQRMIQEKTTMSALRMKGQKKRSSSEVIDESTKQIKVEQED